MVDYMQQYGAGLERVSSTFGPTPNYSALPPSVEEIDKQLQAMTPKDKMAEQRKWRDQRLSALAKLKRDL